jgi:hypothetical protein
MLKGSVFGAGRKRAANHAREGSWLAPTCQVNYVQLSVWKIRTKVLMLEMYMIVVIMHSTCQSNKIDVKIKCTNIYIINKTKNFPTRSEKSYSYA